MSTTIVKPVGISPPTGTYSHGVLVPPGTQLFFVAGQVPIAVDGSDQLADLTLVQQQFARAPGLVLEDVRLQILGDVGVVEP